MLAGFEKRNDVWAPVIWEIANYHGTRPNVYHDITKEFRSGEAPFRNPESGKDVSSVSLKEFIKKESDRYRPWWIHQGQDLGTFNLLEAFLKAAFGLLCENHPSHTLPQNLSDWERQVRMSILTYAAYFQAYKKTNEQLVGGGVDTIWMPWPD